MVLPVTIMIIAYLMGSVSSAVLVCRALRLEDPRNIGSGNPGATNVLRVHGKKAAILTLLGDILKGLFPVLIAHAMEVSDLIVALTGLCAFVGHLFPVFFGFRGGKGVATLIGVLLGTSWLLGLAFIVSWVLVALITRYSSVSGLAASILAPLYAYFILPAIDYVVVFFVMAILLIWRHQSNIRNLIHGEETKIRFNKY